MDKALAGIARQVSRRTKKPLSAAEIGKKVGTVVNCVFRPKTTPIPLAKRHSFRSKSALVPMQIGTPV
jgi:hypothetical protein